LRAEFQKFIGGDTPNPHNRGGGDLDRRCALVVLRRRRLIRLGLSRFFAIRNKVTLY